MNMFWNKKDEKKSLPDLPQIKSPFSRELTVSSENPDMVENKLSENEEDYEIMENEKHALPSFPDSPTNKGFSQAAIKEAITQDGIKNKTAEDDDEAENPIDKNKKFNAVEMDDEKRHFNDENPYIVSMAEYPKKKVSSIQQIKSYDSKYSKQSLPSIIPPPKDDEDLEIDDIQQENISPFVKTERQMDSQKGNDIFIKLEKFYSAKKSLEAIKNQIDQIDDVLKKIKDIKAKEEKELGIWEKEISLVKSRIQNVNDTIFEKIS